MYYAYWNLEKAPFDNVPDPSMYVDCHESMENAIAETLFAIEEGGESLSVIIGDVGLGKTLSLRMIIDSLDPGKYKMALITNPSITFIELTKEIIGQLTGKPCAAKRKVDLLETFNRVLFETMDEGRKVLIFIDEANAIAPANLEHLRLLTNMQEDRQNLFTMVLAGQNELGQRLKHPKRANLFQRIGTYNRIEKIQPEVLVKTYVETRLKRAGATESMFLDDAYGPLWNHSEQGVPRLINKICKLCLKAGETNGFDCISGEVVDAVGQRFQRVTVPPARRAKPDSVFQVNDGDDPLPAMQPREQVMPVDLEEQHQATPAEYPALRMDTREQAEPPAPVASDLDNRRHASPEPKAQPRLVFQNAAPVPSSPPAAETADHSMADRTVAIEIGDTKATVVLPLQVIEQAQSSPREQNTRLAGTLAAEFLKQNPQYTVSLHSDPVEVWSKIRESILHAFDGERELWVM